MGCSGGLCGQERVFIFINIAFAMYSGALLSTAARLAWDPSTYTWFRFLCAAQYRVSAGYVLAAGAWLAALVYLAAAAARLAPAPARATSSVCLHLYCGGVVTLVVSEVGYGAWMAVSLAAWWRSAPQAALARRGADLLHDLKPALLAMERYRDVARPLYDMIEEVEQQAPNNVYVIAVLVAVGSALQLAALLLARRLAAAAPRPDPERGAKRAPPPCACDTDSEDAASAPAAAALAADWRRHANLRMYTILDKIF